MAVPVSRNEEPGSLGPCAVCGNPVHAWSFARRDGRFYHLLTCYAEAFPPKNP